MSTPIIIALMIIACLLIYFLFIEVLKFLGGDSVVEVEKKEEMSIEFLHFPPEIEKMSEFLISSIVRKIYDVYAKFDYKNALEDKLDEKEWHTWQISMLLKLYKYNQEFYISNKEEIFHKSILELDLKSLKSLTHSLVIKYENNVMISKSKDALCKDVIWTVRDVSILFCYLSKYREI